MAIQIPYTDGFITPEGGNNFESKNNKGQVNGYAPLDANAKVPLANLPPIDVSGSISTHNSATTSVHGIANTANLVLTSDSRLTDSRQPTAHTHTKSEITDFTHTHAVTDVTGLQNALDGKQASGSYAPATHTHDDRYYTETEIDTKLSGLPAGGHTHDERYYTETEMDTLLNGKQASGSYAPSTGIAPSAITGTAVVTNDARLSDNRTPTAHKSSHATGGSDPLTPSDIGAQPASPAPSIQFSSIDSSDNWFKKWGRSYGSLGYAQFCPIPLTPNSGVNPLYSDSALYAPNDFTDPGHNIEFTAPYVLDMLENPAHALPFVVTPPDYKLYYSYASKPSFISRWRIKGEHWWSRPHSLDNNSGRVVNFAPTGVWPFTAGYPMFGTKCTDARSMVRQGAYSHGAVNGIATVADFVLAQTAQFKLGICIDAVADLNYRPDQIIVARGVATGSGGPAEPITYATEISSAVKATSSQIVGAVYPKLVIFNVSCNAGDTITVQFKSTGPSENNATWLTRVMAVSMFTFDPL